GDKAVSLSLDRTLRLWNLRTGTLLRVLSGPGAERQADYLRARTIELDDAVAVGIDSTELTIARGARLAISSDGMRAIFADGGTIGIWPRDSGRVVSTVIEDFQAGGARRRRGRRDRRIPSWNALPHRSGRRPAPDLSRCGAGQRQDTA